VLGAFAREYRRDPRDELRGTARAKCAGMRLVLAAAAAVAIATNSNASADNCVRLTSDLAPCAMDAGASGGRGGFLARKHRRTAIGLSLGTTFGGLAVAAVGYGAFSVFATSGERGFGRDALGSTGMVLMTAGGVAFVVGPSLGHSYVGDGWNTGLKLRIASLAPLAVAGLALGPCILGDSSSAACYVSGGMLAVSIGMYVTGAIYEIATSGRAADRYNRDHGLDASLGVAPIRTRDGVAPGLAIVGRF
jgi:hypothetical protein